jgi:hypothetical protein
MKAHSVPDNERLKVGDLTVAEFNSLLQKNLIQAIAEALLKVIPQHDPDEDVYWTTQQAADFIGVWRQTVQEKKKRGLIKFVGEGRLSRTTKAECKRYLKEHGVPTRSVGKQVEFPVRKKWKGRKKK